MKDREKYFELFGRLNSLVDRIPWTTAVSHFLEWLTWNTRYVLGVSKTEYWKRAVELSSDDAIRNAPLQQRLDYVSRKLDDEAKRSEQPKRYARSASTIASAREAVRRAKFFSEAYLNEEFDIFWSLVSSKYLDAFYRQFTNVRETENGQHMAIVGSSRRVLASGRWRSTI